MGTNEEEAHRRAKILEDIPHRKVNWEDYKEIIEASEPWDPIQWPENHAWAFIPNVPMKAFREVSIDAIADVEDPMERREHKERYKQILKLLKRGDAPWPVIVADTGQILDGYHRVAAMRTLEYPSVDVLYVMV